MIYHLTTREPRWSGGSADLYLARPDNSTELVVVKLLRDFGDAHARKGFLREAGILMRGLPGFMPILDAAHLHDAQPFYVMPYCERSLRSLAIPLPEAQLLWVASELPRALAGAHAASISHGDIKPDNVYVDQYGLLRVADPLGNGLGCTRHFSDKHGGTAIYSAPERLQGKPISHASDVYSCGVILHELLTGQRPRLGQRFDVRVTGRIGSERVCDAIAACCQANPDARPNMSEVVRIIQGESWSSIQAARKQLEAERLSALQPRRSSALVGTLLAGAILFAVGASLSDS